MSDLDSKVKVACSTFFISVAFMVIGLLVLNPIVFLVGGLILLLTGLFGEEYKDEQESRCNNL